MLKVFAAPLAIVEGSKRWSGGIRVFIVFVYIVLVVACWRAIELFRANFRTVRISFVRETILSVIFFSFDLRKSEEAHTIMFTPYFFERPPHMYSFTSFLEKQDRRCV
jgi:hypothetical protein